jgi:hypothetical protein
MPTTITFTKNQEFTAVSKGQMFHWSEVKEDSVEQADEEVVVVKTKNNGVETYTLLVDLQKAVLSKDGSMEVTAQFVAETTREHYIKHAPALTWHMPNGKTAIIVS